MIEATPTRQTLDKTISHDDCMFQGNVEHYFSCGESAMNVIRLARLVAGADVPKRILDYGAGAGRVTRWLKASFPRSEIHACDIREQDMDFLRTYFGVCAWAVATDPTRLNLTVMYDLIWVGSVITHLPEMATKTLIEKLLAACNPGGLLVLSSHGEFAVERQETTNFRYIDNNPWSRIKAGYLATGYGYADYNGQSDYGISVIDPRWLLTFSKTLTTRKRVALLSERAWDAHHDVLAIQRQ
jgi:SAM-dependent methyltransferase